MEVQNRRGNAKKPLFVTRSHHCLTRNGGLVSAIQAGEMLREAVFSDLPSAPGE
jgi:hypothetical protein